MRNIKFHLFAVAAICVVITLLFFLIGPRKLPAPSVDGGGKAIHIASATWGENCNEALAPLPGSPMVAHNNVLTVVGQVCDGKLTCTLRAEPKSLGGVDPMLTCYKMLIVDYRCYNVDKLKTVEISQGEMLAIDCRKDSVDAPARTSAE